MAPMKGFCVLVAALAAGVAARAAELERSTPEAEGVPSSAITAWIDACERELDAVHGFVIVRHGRTIAEGWWRPFSADRTHMLYSHSKSFTSTAVGLLADDGKLDLDERVVDLFPDKVPSAPSTNLGLLRIRDLLTMNTGMPFTDPERKDPAGDWVKLFLANEVKDLPGTKYRYDSCATYMLSAIVEKKTGRRLMDFLGERLFRPIGIEKAWSTTSPQGIACGGWGMNMTTRELARFGQLYLNRGDWDGKRVLSSDWVSLATTRQTWSGWQNVGVKALGEGTDWEQGYGFQFWRCRHGAYRADGAGGQYTVVIPEKDMVVSAHAGLGDFPKELDLIWDNLLPVLKDAPLAENPSAQKKLADRLAKLAIKPVEFARARKWTTPFEFSLRENSRGFKSVRFDPKDGGGCICTLVTRAGEQKFPAGTGEWQEGSIRIDTENYEGLGAYIGEHKTMASCGFVTGGFHLKAYLTGTTGYLEFIVKDGKLTGQFYAMGGCRLESK